MTDLFEIVNDKGNNVSDNEIFDKDEDQSFFNEQINLKDASRCNEKADLIAYTLDFKLFVDYNKAVNENDMSCDINDDDLYYTKPKNTTILSIINNEEKEIKNNTSNTSISNRNGVELQQKTKIFAKLGRKRKGEIYDKEKVHNKESKDKIKKYLEET